ncbi:MAG: ATP-dependent 6-phosphofructokinase [Turneriella sp.]
MVERIAVITSGGDVPGLNACIRAIVHTAAHHKIEVMGVRHGYDGLISGELVPLNVDSVHDIMQRGGTILHSARSKRFETGEGRTAAGQTLAKHGITNMIVIGGDGSLTGAGLFAKEHGLHIVGIPKTIDNDVTGTDICIGYDTAVNTAMEALDRIRDTADSHERMFVIEVMGRDSGYIAYAAGIAGAADGILIPETTTDWNLLTQVLRERHAGRTGSLLIVVAEGDESGGAEKLGKKLAQEFPNEKLGICVLGHTQRGGSPSAADRILASRFGVAATDAIAAGKTNIMVGIQGDQIAFTPLNEIRRKHLELTAERQRLLQMLL